MSFGQILKEIRNNNGDSLRILSDKSGIHHTFIDKIEKGEKKPSENVIEGLFKTYPLYKRKLAIAYCKEKLPSIILEEINIDIEDIDDDFLDGLLELLRMIDSESQKNILTEMIEKIEYIKLKNGEYKEVENLIKEAKEKIEKL